MTTRRFSDLASQAKNSWSDQATAVHRAAAASYDAELAARRHLGGLLASARADSELSQPALSRASGVQQAEISRIEAGRSNPTFSTLNRLAAALNVRLTLTEERAAEDEQAV